MADYTMWSGSGPPLPRRPAPHVSPDHDVQEENQFFKINEKSEEEGTDSGVYASEEVCKSKLAEDQDLSDVIRCINTEDSKYSSEMITHVHTCIIPKARSQCDMETLALLLDCDHKPLERRVARVMSELLFETDMRSYNYLKLLSSLNALFPVLQKRAMSPESMMNIQPIMILVLLVLHHQSLNHPDRKAISDTIKDNLQSYIASIERLCTLDSSPALLNLRQSLQMVVTSLQEVLIKDKMSRLQLGNFSEELRDVRHRNRLSKDFSKMSMLEHYSLMFGVLIQISKFPVTMETLDFLRACVVSVLDYYKKKSKGEQHIYALLLLTTRAVINTLEKRHMKHTADSTRCSLQEKLCEILQMIVCSSKIKTEVRHALQEEATILVFHETGAVVQRVSEMLQKNSSLVLNDTLLRYLTQSLESLSFSSHTTAIESSHLRWHTVRGTIVGHIHVSTQVFLPSAESMLNGTFDIETYRRSATKVPQTAEHYNTLKVLRKLSAYGPNEHVQRLFAFQTEPLPLFYMTETLPEIQLSTHLLAHRKNRKWISEKLLGLMGLGAVKALRFLHDGGLIHRNITADSFRYRGQTVVLSDFSIVKALPVESEVLEEHAMQVTADIPIRWSAYESLCEDEFSHASDVWMFGQLLYEIFTHGCHPYTDIYGYDLDDVMDMVLFHELKPKWWPCTPRAIHDVIVACVHASPRERMSLRNAQDAIEKWLDTTKCTTSHSGSITFSNRGSSYPELNQLQQDKPERGTTMNLSQLKSLDGNVKDLYYNTLKKRKGPSDTLQIAEGDLTAPDHPVIRQEGIYLHVEEPVSQKFIDGPLDRMKSEDDFATKQHIVNFPPQKKPRESTVENGFTYTLLYRCFQGKSLLDIAVTNLLGDPTDAANEVAYANIIKEAVLFVSDMHKKRWILRDICCSTLFKSKAKGKVFMPRIGRFLKCQSPVGCVTDKCTNTEDRRNWMPVEVLQDKTYSLASDVYMLAMTVYEFYASASVAKNNPVANRLEAVPFATLAPQKLLDSLYREEIPNQPPACPEWMYRLLKSCWNRDPTRRPTAHQLLADIESMILEMSDDIPDVSCGNSSFGTDSARSTYATIDSVRKPILPQHSRKLPQQVGDFPYQITHQKSVGIVEETTPDTDGYIHATHNDSDVSSDGEIPAPASHGGITNSNMQEPSQTSTSSGSCCSPQAARALDGKESNSIAECGASHTDSNLDQTIVTSSSENSNAVSLSEMEVTTPNLTKDTNVKNYHADCHNGIAGSSVMGCSDTTPNSENDAQKLLHAEPERTEVWV